MVVNDIADAITYDRRALHRTLRRNPEIFEGMAGVVILTTPQGVQEHLAVNRDGLVGLLVKIEYKRVKDPEKRQLIIEFQRWAIKKLGQIVAGELPQEEFQPWTERAEQHLRFAKALAETSGVKPGIALAAAIDAAEKEIGRSLEAYKRLLPPADHETAYLTASDIGQRFNLTAVKVNKLLQQLGLIEQREDAKGRKVWRLTERGKEYGEEFPFVRNGHSGYQVKWNERVLGLISQA
ncbi:MAG: hypothetical protein K6U74_04715 [Firmicutes bacterium]|nr:hypothetical protein [Bacillota bacterium]